MDRDIFESLSPVDYRYWHERLAPFLSEKAFTWYKLKVEVALLRALQDLKLCPAEVVEEVAKACALVTTQDVYDEEKKIGHDIKALVNCLRAKVSDKAKPYVHMTATSFDISDTANAARYKAFTQQVLIPALKELMAVLIALARAHAHTVQIGRTHGQHAVPITFGFTISGYVDRLCVCIHGVSYAANHLEGKFSGAVGAYNASSLFVSDPVKFEKSVLEYLELQPAGQSSQIVPPESLHRLVNEMQLLANVLANMSDDMRNLSRTEIREVAEGFRAKQVGSSTMPQKRNPLNFENIKSLWKVLVGRMVTLTLDSISDHQRDLTNSASARTIPEIFGYLYAMVLRMTSTMKELVVSPENMAKNLALQQGLVLAEPLQVILASLGHADAHEKVRLMTLESEKSGKPLHQMIFQDSELFPYLDRMTDDQKAILGDPNKYVGIAGKKAVQVVQACEEFLEKSVH